MFKTKASLQRDLEKTVRRNKARLEHKVRVAENKRIQQCKLLGRAVKKGESPVNVRALAQTVAQYHRQKVALQNQINGIVSLEQRMHHVTNMAENLEMNKQIDRLMARAIPGMDTVRRDVMNHEMHLSQLEQASELFQEMEEPLDEGETEDVLSEVWAMYAHDIGTALPDAPRELLEALPSAPRAEPHKP